LVAIVDRVDAADGRVIPGRREEGQSGSIAAARAPEEVVRVEWSSRSYDGEIVTRLTELDRQISQGEREYHPFAYLDASSGS